jgi:hypothetical protein
MNCDNGTAKAPEKGIQRMSSQDDSVPERRRKCGEKGGEVMERPYEMPGNFPEKCRTVFAAVPAGPRQRQFFRCRAMTLFSFGL